MNIQTILISIIVFMSSGFSVCVTAQNPDFLDKGAIYQIQLGSFEEKLDLTKFDNLKDLGEVTTTSLEFDPGIDPTGTRVFLGKYLGVQTAKNILKEVKRRGYPEAFLESDHYTLGHSTGLHISSAIQVGAYKKLKMDQFDSLKEKWDLYIYYEKGYYKVLTALHDPAMRTVGFPTMLMELDKLGFEAYPRSFR